MPASSFSPNGAALMRINARFFFWEAASARFGDFATLR
jgi:hypothetical protein